MTQQSLMLYVITQIAWEVRQISQHWGQEGISPTPRWRLELYG